jgi:SHS2 domain-containing protein
LRPRRRCSPPTATAKRTTSSPAPDRGYEILEHTADAGLRAWAPDLSGVLEQAALGLIAVMGIAQGEVTRTERVTLEAPDGVALLVDWLSEVLFLFDARGFVPVAVHAVAAEWRVDAELSGTGEIEQAGAVVKAVTYHDAHLERTPSGYGARVYLDV